ncbi:hypothetical protein M404DRAFT_1001613, partial [Pisolithus tinctorius Marx 270]
MPHKARAVLAHPPVTLEWGGPGTGGEDTATLRDKKKTDANKNVSVLQHLPLLFKDTASKSIGIGTLMG